MKINKIAPINPIPKHHLKWAGPHKELVKKKAKPEILRGELTLYNRYGKIIKYNTKE